MEAQIQSNGILAFRTEIQRLHHAKSGNQRHTQKNMGIARGSDARHSLTALAKHLVTTANLCSNFLSA
jgi:hypothetical protein